MLVPLSNAKMVLGDLKIDLKFIDYKRNLFRFEVPNQRQFALIDSELGKNQLCEFISTSNNQVIRWKAFVANKISQGKVLIFSDPVVYSITGDSRKERIHVKDKVFITDIEFGGRILDLGGKSIPALSQDISSSGILLGTTLDLSKISEESSHKITIKFEGDILGELGEKKVIIKRFFKNNNIFYYGCQFDLMNYYDIQSINKVVQALILHK